MIMKKKIFVIDDEKDIQDILRINLEHNNYEVYTYSSAEEARKSLKKNIPDLILLDVMMEGTDGFEFCKFLRMAPDYAGIPVIFLTARTEEFDTVLGLELGGDDYITKPFSIKEILSRIKAVLRRMERGQAAAEPAKISYRGIELFPEQYALRVDGKNVKLTKTEFDILLLLLKHPGKIFSRDNLIDSIRGDNVYIIDRTIDVHIMNIRKKLGTYKDIICTYSGVGYGFFDE